MPPTSEETTKADQQPSKAPTNEARNTEISSIKSKQVYSDTQIKSENESLNLDSLNRGVYRMGDSASTLSGATAGEHHQADISTKNTLLNALEAKKQYLLQQKKLLIEPLNYEQFKNNFYTKHVLELLRRKTRYHAEAQMESLKKYRMYLDQMEEAEAKYATRQRETNNELDMLRNQRNERRQRCEDLFNGFQDAQMNSAKMLVAPDDVIEKVLDKSLKRQKTQIVDLANLRLQFIKHRNLVNEKQAKLDDLDNLGPDLRLVDYEDMKATNRTYRDKLEERDNEIVLLRKRCENNAQVMAHVKEEVDGVDKDIVNFNAALEEVLVDYDDIRGQLNYVKVKRDEVRKKHRNTREEAGMLLQPKLLTDMSQTLMEIESTEQELRKYKEELDRNAKILHKMEKILQSKDKLKEFKRIQQENMVDQVRSGPL